MSKSLPPPPPKKNCPVVLQWCDIGLKGMVKINAGGIHIVPPSPPHAMQWQLMDWHPILCAKNFFLIKIK